MRTHPILIQVVAAALCCAWMLFFLRSEPLEALLAVPLAVAGVAVLPAYPILAVLLVAGPARSLFGSTTCDLYFPLRPASS